MKPRFGLFFFGLMVACLLSAAPFSALADYDQDAPAAGLGLARVSYLSGDTLFNSPDTDEWAALSPNFTLREGDRLWAGEDSKLEVNLYGGQYAWLNYNTGLDLVRLNRDGASVFQVGLTSGEASFSVNRRAAQGSVFQVDTPNVSVRAYKRAAFRVSVQDDGATQVGVSKGSAEVETAEGVTRLGRGEMAEVDPDGYVSITSLPPNDGWDDWVASREQRYRRPAASARYLPKEMSDYGYEFDEGGRWTSYPEYGNVWIPAVDPGWSPYSNGRWVFTADDYVWLPFDPWYAPFHFGRWSWSVSIGWFWVPPLPGVSFWSPGYVGWVYGPDSVCWVPLAPRETYYGRGYYGPDSVNVHTTKIVNVTNVYINSRVNNGVVLVDRDRFLTGETRRVAIKDQRQNPFINIGARNTRIIAAPPVVELKPVKETRLPMPKARPAEQTLPPAHIERLAPIIRQRAVVTQGGKEKSAFTPSSAPPRMEKRERRSMERAAPFREKGTGTFQPAAPAAPPATERPAAGGNRPEPGFMPGGETRPRRSRPEEKITPPPVPKQPERDIVMPRVERPSRPSTPAPAPPAVEQPSTRTRPAPPATERPAVRTAPPAERPAFRPARRPAPPVKEKEKKEKDKEKQQKDEEGQGRFRER